ncbi:MFS transporter [Oceanobacillus senegalensis]|uniref:MFS transporter n=1 Tax=Oceanobacillus senegalensis TaxID=1936063 RepID=UPI000A30ADE3|nr:MFS transporter [Oceanobacillus senegalensis]
MLDKDNNLKNKKLLILAVALGSILNPLNTTMITIALPEIQHQFGLNSKSISWLIASYFIVSAIFLPLIGKFSDYYGRKKIFLIGLSFVAISSLFAPLSPNFLILLGMRTIQAIGTSALYPAGIGIVRNNIKENQNRVIGTLAVFATTSAAFGPTISGLLIQYGGWPVIFYVNFPVIILSGVLAFFYIPNDYKKKDTVFHLDVVGVVLFGSFISCWMIFFLSLEERFYVGILLLSILLTILFYLYESKGKAPFINVNFLINNANISLTYIQYILATLVFFALLLTMPIYLQKVLQINSQLAGLMMLSISFFSMIMTPLTTRWIEKIGYRLPLIIGAFIGLIGTVLLLTTKQSSPLIWIFIVMSIMGISNGIQNIGLQNRLYSFVRPSESGIASGLLMTSRFLGNILASSLYGVTFANGINDEGKNSLSIVLLFVSIVIIPGLFFITKRSFPNMQQFE